MRGRLGLLFIVIREGGERGIAGRRGRARSGGRIAIQSRGMKLVEGIVK